MNLSENVTRLSEHAKSSPEYLDGGCRILHTPSVAPQAYFHRFYPALDLVDLEDLGAYYGRAVPSSFLGFLQQANGARLFGRLLHINGHLVQNVRSSSGLGQPISLRYGNIVERPPYLNVDDFVIGGYVYGEIILPLGCNSFGEVSVFAGPDDGNILHSWKSFECFLSSEIERLVNIYSGDEPIPSLRGKILHFGAI